VQNCYTPSEAAWKALSRLPIQNLSVNPKATWVEPTFIAEVEYRDITSEGLLRQSSFKGLEQTRR
jgi:ATP-dependent DNA ligase